MLASFMKKDLELWMSREFLLFNNKFDSYYTNGLELEEKPFQYVNTLPSIPFVDINISASNAQI